MWQVFVVGCKHVVCFFLLLLSVHCMWICWCKPSSNVITNKYNTLSTSYWHHCDSSWRYVSPAIPPIMDMGVTAFKILNKSIEVTCPDVSLNCLVLLLSTTDNPDQVHVGLINSEDDRTVVLSPGATDVSVVVYTWKRDGSIFSGKLSFRAQLKSLTSKATVA